MADKIAQWITFPKEMQAPSPFAINIFLKSLSIWEISF